MRAPKTTRHIFKQEKIVLKEIKKNGMKLIAQKEMLSIKSGNTHVRNVEKQDYILFNFTTLTHQQKSSALAQIPHQEHKRPLRKKLKNVYAFVLIAMMNFIISTG